MGSAIAFTPDSPQPTLVSATPYSVGNVTPSSIPYTTPTLTSAVITQVPSTLTFAIIAVPSTTPPPLIYAFQADSGNFTEVINSTCFNIDNATLSYTLNATASFLNFVSEADSYM